MILIYGNKAINMNRIESFHYNDVDNNLIFDTGSSFYRFSVDNPEEVFKTICGCLAGNINVCNITHRLAPHKSKFDLFEEE
jgi:hypothetical protein